MLDFVKVAEVNELDEGELLAVEVDGEPICLAKVNNSIYAFTDNCTHISGPLNEGELDGEVLTCPWHGAQFNVLLEGCFVPGSSGYSNVSSSNRGKLSSFESTGRSIVATSPLDICSKNSYNEQTDSDSYKGASRMLGRSHVMFGLTTAVS